MDINPCHVNYRLSGTILTPSILTTPYSDLQEYTPILTHGHTVHSLQEEVREWEGGEKEYSCYIVTVALAMLHVLP